MSFNVKTGIYGLRDMANGDIHYMLNIDRKFSEFPWSFQDWQRLVRDFPNWRINVITLREQLCGFCIWESEETCTNIHRFCYDKKLSNFLIDKMLLKIITVYCRGEGKDYIEYIVRETSCRGNDDPYDKSTWLLNNDFLCVGINPDYFEGYGQSADGYVFRRNIDKCLDTTDESDYDEQTE